MEKDYYVVKNIYLEEFEKLLKQWFRSNGIKPLESSFELKPGIELVKIKLNPKQFVFMKTGKQYGNIKNPSIQKLIGTFEYKKSNQNYHLNKINDAVIIIPIFQF